MSSSKRPYAEDVDVHPLINAFMKTGNIEEKKIINKLIEGLLCGQPFPRQFYESHSCSQMLSLRSQLALRDVLFGPSSNEKAKAGVCIGSGSKGKEKEEEEERGALGSTGKGKEQIRVSNPIIPDKDGWVSMRTVVKKEIVCALTLDPEYVAMHKRSLMKEKTPIPFCLPKRRPLKTKRPILAYTEDDDDELPSGASGKEVKTEYEDGSTHDIGDSSVEVLDVDPQSPEMIIIDWYNVPDLFP